MAFAVGCNAVLLRDGTVQPQGDKAPHPRMSVGFWAAGKEMFLVSVRRFAGWTTGSGSSLLGSVVWWQGIGPAP